MMLLAPITDESVHRCHLLFDNVWRWYFESTSCIGEWVQIANSWMLEGLSPWSAYRNRVVDDTRVHVATQWWPPNLECQVVTKMKCLMDFLSESRTWIFKRTYYLELQWRCRVDMDLVEGLQMARLMTLTTSPFWDTTWVFLWLVILLFVFNLLWSSNRKEFVGQHSGSALFTRRVHSSWLAYDGLRAFAGFTGLAFYHLRFRVLEWCCALQSSSLSSHGLRMWLCLASAQAWSSGGWRNWRGRFGIVWVFTLRCFHPKFWYQHTNNDSNTSFRGTSNLFNYKQTRDS